MTKRCYIVKGAGQWGMDVAVMWRPQLKVWDAFRYHTRATPARWYNIDKLRTPSLLDAIAFVRGRGLEGLGSYDVRRGLPRKFTVAMMFT